MPVLLWHHCHGGDLELYRPEQLYFLPGENLREACIHLILDIVLYSGGVFRVEGTAMWLSGNCLDYDVPVPVRPTVDG